MAGERTTDQLTIAGKQFSTFIDVSLKPAVTWWGNLVEAAGGYVAVLTKVKQEQQEVQYILERATQQGVGEGIGRGDEGRLRARLSQLQVELASNQTISAARRTGFDERNLKRVLNEIAQIKVILNQIDNEKEAAAQREKKNVSDLSDATMQQITSLRNKQDRLEQINKEIEGGLITDTAVLQVLMKEKEALEAQLKTR